MIEETDITSILSMPSEAREEKAREEAFGKDYTWHGKLFEGVSSSRKSLWESLCHHAGYCDLQAAYENTTLLIGHCKALLYVCIAPRQRLKALRASGMTALVEDYEAWVDENIAISEEKAVLDLGIQILNDACINRAEAVETTGSVPGKRGPTL